jgi:Domain of unknown function (DUF6458)
MHVALQAPPDVRPLAGLSITHRGNSRTMPLGTSIFLIAVGAILRYAVTTTVSGISLTTVGLILMIVGIVGLLLSLFYMTLWSRGPRGPRERDPYEERPRTY